MFNGEFTEENLIDDTINECPHCAKRIKAIILKKHKEEFDGTYYLYLICQCPSCYSKFFAEYNYEGYSGVDGFHHYSSEPIYYPFKKEKIFIENEIAELSPNFIISFEEAELVEQIGLIDLSGLAYRKAFEFLIKDFAISLSPEKETEITNDSSVSNIIFNRISDEERLTKIKEIAKRVWWLGSDYAHYKKHYKNKDIHDLKECIDILRYELVINIRYNQQISTIKKIK